MSGVTDDVSLQERVTRYRDRHPDAGVATIAGALGAEPEAVREALDEETPESGKSQIVAPRTA